MPCIRSAKSRSDLCPDGSSLAYLVEGYQLTKEPDARSLVIGGWHARVTLSQGTMRKHFHTADAIFRRRAAGVTQQRTRKLQAEQVIAFGGRGAKGFRSKGPRSSGSRASAATGALGISS